MFIKLVITLTLAAFCSVAAAKDYYVSPSGSDSLNGLSPSVNFWSKTGPFKTLTRARNAIRQLKAAGKFNEAITVHVGKGTYQLQSPLEFNDSDSGLPGQEINWVGEQGATIISGGIVLKNCQPYDANSPERVLSCPLDTVTASTIKGEESTRVKGNTPAFEVFVNENRMNLARWPDDGWAFIKTPITEKTKFTAFQKIPQFTGDLSQAQLHIFAGNDTFDQYVGVSTIDFVNNQITLNNEPDYRLIAGRRFYLRNIQSALNAPEEWFYDSINAKLLFIPPVGATPKSIVISSSINLIKITNASHISFSKLTFRHSTGDAVKILNSDSISIDKSELNFTGGLAIRATNSTNITIADNHIHDSGQGGVLISGGDRTTLTSSGNVAENNHIEKYDDILFNNSPAIEIGGVGAHIAHNLIEDGSGNGIFISGNDHIIEKNEIARICQQAADCGAIYSGRNWTYRGNIIRFNSIHDIPGYELNYATLNIPNNIIEYIPNGARGIYIDDAASGFNIFGNILVNSGQMSIHIGGGRDNQIENNVIKTNKYAILIDNRGNYFDWQNMKSTLETMPITSPAWLQRYPNLSAPMLNENWPENNTIRSNVLISTQNVNTNIFLRYFMPRQTNIISNNLAWRSNSTILKADYKILDAGVARGGALWNVWLSEGFEANSRFADPCFNIIGNTIQATCSSSPAYQLGFKNIPTDIGLIN
ncbi:right-handed parallel beta-helix repeat-containing protein [Methylomonas sp. YC3]